MYFLCVHFNPLSHQCRVISIDNNNIIIMITNPSVKAVTVAVPPLCPLSWAASHLVVMAETS